VHLPTDSLEDVYNSVRPVLLDAVNGVNAAIIAYGAVGAGKTLTMVGSFVDDRCAHKVGQQMWGVREEYHEAVGGVCERSTMRL
jgi:hypothetical protein